MPMLVELLMKEVLTTRFITKIDKIIIDMYTFSNKLKTFSFLLMILGVLGVGFGFMTSHKSFEDVEHHPCRRGITPWWWSCGRSFTCRS